MRAVIISLILLMLMAVPASGAGEAERIRRTVEQTVDVQQKTQEKRDAWERKKQELIAQYRSLEAEKDHLVEARNRAEATFAAARKRVEEAERKVRETARIREGLESYLGSVIDRLDEFIRRDLPFLPKERADRIASIRHLLAQPEVPVAEKYRRVMEALQVETEYGRTVEVYKDTIELKGQPVLVGILRLGRLSLFFETPDGRLVGEYNPAKKQWCLLSSSYRRDINKAVEMARRERTIELVRLPIGRIVVK